MTGTVPAEAPWCCAACGIEVADRDAECSVRGQAPLGRFTNPHGVTFEVLTVADARNLRIRGPPTSAFSWFPGYAWSLATCAGCRGHLGWRFDAADGAAPTTFFGLVRTAIR